MLANLTPAQTTRIKEAANLQAVVGEFVRLRPAGADTLVGLCPFHNEKSPSFKVHPTKGFYKCFGCGATGDAITFTRHTQGLSFPAAARQLAEQYGVSLTDQAAHVTREQLAYARQLAAECAWWWARVRLYCTAQQHVLVGIEKRAAAFLAARVDAEDSPGIEYAWWWIANAGRMYAEWQARADRINEMAPADLMAGYREVRVRVRPGFEEDRLMWAGYRAEMVQALRGMEGAA